MTLAERHVINRAGALKMVKLLNLNATPDRKVTVYFVVPEYRFRLLVRP